ncbi:MAG: hypothetical protein RLZZ227_89 [Pseudomonadota bacterium]|jgi:opacity protein-like surface antigen
MKLSYRCFAIALTGLAVVPAALCAQEQEDREPQNYIGAHVGMHDVDEWLGSVDLGNNIAFDGVVRLDSKWEAGLMLGREYAFWRWELEYQQGRYDAKSIQLGTQTGTVSDSGKYQALTLNAYRVEQLSERIDVYAGLGIGWGMAALPAMGFTGGCQCFAAAENTGFVWQWRLGAEYRIGDNQELFVQYSQIMNLPGPEATDRAPMIHYENRDIATVGIGWRWPF